MAVSGSRPLVKQTIPLGNEHISSLKAQGSEYKLPGNSAIVTCLDFITHRIHGTGKFTYIYHTLTTCRQIMVNISYMDPLGW